MAEKHIIIKHHNGTSWDSLYPETTIQQVKNGSETLDITLGKKVDKVSGKQLSTNDFTNSLKNKLESIKPSEVVTVSKTEPTDKTGVWFELKE